MDKITKTNDVVTVILSLKDVMLGFSGGAIAYFLKYKKEKEAGNTPVFDIGILIINMLMGGFVSYIVGTGLDEHMPYRDFIIGGLGVTAYNFLTILESSFANYIYNKLVDKSFDKNDKLKKDKTDKESKDENESNDKKKKDKK